MLIQQTTLFRDQRANRYKAHRFAHLGLLLILAGRLDAAEVTVGDNKITLPAPTGFTDITAIAPDTVALFQDMCPSNNRILAVFATTKDTGHILRGEDAALKRYLIAQSVRSLENVTVSSPLFAELRKRIRGEYEELFRKSKPQLDALTESAGRNLTKRFGDATSMKIGQMIPLSIDSDTTYSISLSALTKYAFEFAGKKSDFVSAGTMSMTLLKDRVVYLNVFSAYDTDEDLKWTRETSAQWSLASVKANSKTFDASIGSIVPPGTRVDTIVSALLTETQALYSTAGHSKSRGLNISVKYPTSWKAEEGIRPHIVQKFTGDHVGGITPMCMLVVQELPTIAKVLLDQGGSEELFSDGGADLIPPGARRLDSASTKIDGQPAAWVKYYYESERAGVRAGIYGLQFMTYFKGSMFVLQCGVAGLGDSPEILRDAFDTYLPLFQAIGNSIVIEDKWAQTPTSGALVSSVVKDTYGEYWWITLILSAILTWGIGLLPPLLIRFVFAKHAIPKPSALIAVVVLWILNLVIFTALGSTSKTHVALLLVAWASYSILRKGSATYDAQRAKDADTRRQRETAERAQAERMRQEQEQHRAEEAKRQADEAKRRAAAEEERRDNERRRAQQEEEKRKQDERQRDSRGASSSRVKDERYYASVLGLHGPTSPDDVRRQYRELVTQYHPDKVNHLGHKLKEVAESEMKEINEAYEYLKKKYGIG